MKEKICIEQCNPWLGSEVEDTCLTSLASDITELGFLFHISFFTSKYKSIAPPFLNKNAKQEINSYN
jgi:hypothetical protein